MSKSSLAAKLKGYSRTVVVYSSNDRYAAAALMGAATGRHQQLGPYFRLLPEPNPGAQPTARQETTPNSPEADLTVNFINDWVDFLRQKGLPVCGLEYEDNPDPVRNPSKLDLPQFNTMRYLNAHNRRIPAAVKRKVYESKELSIPLKHKADYQVLVELLRTGGDLRPYMSRDIAKKQCPDKNDLLLNEWGIQHLHFQPEGTDHILLCKINDADVYVLQALPHRDGVWTDPSILQILHDNWPEQIAAGKCPGINGEALSPDERADLRRQNTNVPVAMDDGATYLAPGGGATSTGDCIDDLWNCDRIFGQLRQWEELVKSNASSLRAALEWPATKALSIKMMFKGRNCRLCEPTTDRTISLIVEG